MPARLLPFGSNTLAIPAYLVTDENEPAFLQWKRDHPEAFLAGTWSRKPSTKNRKGSGLADPEAALSAERLHRWESDPVAVSRWGSRIDPSTMSVQEFIATSLARADETAPASSEIKSAPSSSESRDTLFKRAADQSEEPSAPQDTPEIRNALATRLIRPGHLATPEDVAVVHDYMVARVPAESMRLMLSSHLHVQVTRGAVRSELPGFAGRQPRGYASGTGWSGVVGTYDEFHHAVVIATRDGQAGTRRVPDSRDSGSVDALMHEAGHGINYTQSPWYNVSNTDEFIQAYRQDAGAGRLSADYYHQEHDGRAGRDEAFAESFAMYNSDPASMQRDYPHLFAFFRSFMFAHRGG